MIGIDWSALLDALGWTLFAALIIAALVLAPAIVAGHESDEERRRDE